MHLLKYVVKCTVTDSPLNTQTRCSKRPPPALINFLTRVVRERSTAALLMLLAALRSRWSSSSLVFTLCAIHTTFSAISILNLRTCVASWNCVAGWNLNPIWFVKFCSSTRPILPAMESTIQEIPIYGIMIIHMEMWKAITNIVFSVNV